MTIAILGSGAAGISAGYHAQLKKQDAVIFEKDNTWGGLCGNFNVNGFRFDRFVHLSFADDKSIQELFSYGTGMNEFTPFPSNYYKGKWLRHPAQNNLAPLSLEEKVKIILDFIKRPNKSVNEIKNYAEWLVVQYGETFAKNFPFIYTEKYWGIPAEELETKWVGKRMYTPDLQEVLKGSYETQETCFYFAKKMFYPKEGGFKTILKKCAERLDIKFNKKVVKIDPKNNMLFFLDKSTFKYDELISSIPLPEIILMLPDVPNEVKLAAEKLRYTCGFQVSLGFNRPDIPRYLWFYIYDKDILPARVYSPSLKSLDNVPSGCSSLQAEIYYDSKRVLPSKEYLLKRVVSELLRMKLFKEEDIVVSDVRFEPYANITFVPSIYENREIVLDYLRKLNIKSIGRFGKWDYLWSHQAFADGWSI